MVQRDDSYSPPTDEQLGRFIEVSLLGAAERLGITTDAAFGARMVLGNPVMKEEWLRRHRELQEVVDRG